jgi:hypothetical protein
VKVLTTALAALALVAAACGPEQQAVCTGEPEHVVIVTSTSLSEYETSRDLVRGVVRQAVSRVVRSCGRLTVGIMTNNPERDLVLRSRSFAPDETAAYNREPILRRMLERARRFARRHQLDPLEDVEPTRGSPFFTTYAKIGRELRAHDWPAATVLSVGDGLTVERSPSGTLVRFDRGIAPRRALNEFVQMLGVLRESCVLLVGQGGTDGTGPSPGRIRTAERLLRRTLERAGVRFVSTRSSELPPGCASESAPSP